MADKNIRQAAVGTIKEEKKKEANLAAIERDFKAEEEIQRDFKAEEEQENLLRSQRFMEFDEKELNECIDSDEEGKEHEFKPASSGFNSDSGDSKQQDEYRAKSMIFKPFKPGHPQNFFRQIPNSALEIKMLEPLFKRNQRKLPIDLLKKQQTIERQFLMDRPKPLVSNEAQERDSKIKAMLANIPCMSRETLQKNRRKIEK